MDLLLFRQLVDVCLLWLFSEGHGHSDPGEAGVRIHQQSPAADHDAKPGEIPPGSAVPLLDVLLSAGRGDIVIDADPKK